MKTTSPLDRVRPLTAGLVGAVAWITGCDSTLGTGCDASSVPGIRLDVVDSVSGLGVPGAAGARAIAFSRSGIYADTVEILSSHVALAYDKGGVFGLRVDYPGYLQWNSDVVRVTENGCDPIPVSLTARLQRPF